MGNHDMRDYLRRIMLALCSNGVPAEPASDAPGVTTSHTWAGEASVPTEGGK